LFIGNKWLEILVFVMYLRHLKTQNFHYSLKHYTFTDNMEKNNEYHTW
jgi:hypothetical protein